MELSTFLNWFAVALQFAAAGALMIWPDQKWIGIVIMLTGLLIALISGALFLSTKGFLADLKRAWFLLPIGMGISILFIWIINIVLVENPNEFIITDTTKLEVITGKTFRNEQVVLDGKGFHKNRFINVTFVYDGTTPSVFTHNEIVGSRGMKTNNKRADAVISAGVGLGIFTIVGEFIQPPGQNVEPPQKR